jgi:hypothetical protein
VVLPVSHKVPRAPWYSGYRFGPPCFRLQGSHLLRPRFPSRLTSMTCSYSRGPTTPVPSLRPVWASPLSLATTQGMQSLSLFLRVHEMFQFPAFPYVPYVFRYVYRSITRGGFPHSDTPGSKPVCGSPRLFAAYRVLHRLLAPRHPPYALRSLTNISIPFNALSFFSALLFLLLLPFPSSISYCFQLLLPLCGCQRASRKTSSLETGNEGRHHCFRSSFKTHRLASTGRAFAWSPMPWDT